MTMTYEYTLTTLIPAPPTDVYDAWMSSEGHSAMTGAEADIDPGIGGTYEAWDGYISGRTLELEPGRRIVQSWRTTEFGPDDPDSTIDVVLEPAGAGTLLTLHHSGVPDGQTDYEETGWESSYFEPMVTYFSR